MSTSSPFFFDDFYLNLNLRFNDDIVNEIAKFFKLFPLFAVLRSSSIIGIIVIKLQTSHRVITSSVLSLTGPDWVKVQLSHGHCA